MKRVTLTKLHPSDRGVTQAIKCLRAASDGRPGRAAVMGLKEAKDTVDALRAGRTPTVKVFDTKLLSDWFEFTIQPEGEHFHSTNGDSTVLVTDNYPLGADGCGRTLLIECANGDVPMATYGVLDTSRDCESATLERTEVQRLYDWLGDWLGKP